MPSALIAEYSSSVRIEIRAKSEPPGEKFSEGNQSRRNVLEGRRESSCKTKRDGDRQEGVERVLRSAGREEHDGATLVLDVFNLVAAFSRALAL